MDSTPKDATTSRLEQLLAIRKCFPLLSPAFFLPLPTTTNPSSAKPAYCFIGLISRCILKSSERRLKLTEIYKSLWDEYPYFHKNTSWKHSIRRNLSLNACFVKSDWSKKMLEDFQPQSKDIQWSVHPACIKDFERGEYDKTRIRMRIEKTLSE